MTKFLVSTKGKKILEHQNYLYHYHSSNKKKTRSYWRCEQRGACNARCITNYEIEQQIIIYKHGPHIHESNVVEGKVREIVEAVKRKAMAEPNRPASAIIREEMRNVDDEELLQCLPERNTMKRNVNRYQNKKRPNLPGDLKGLIIEPPYDSTLSNKKFLQFDSMNKNGSTEDESSEDGRSDDESSEEEGGKERIIIFYTNENLEHLVRSRIIFCDGTFKTAPAMFYQMYTFHGVVYGHVFPLIYVITTRKTEETYITILKHLKDAAAEKSLWLKPEIVLSDFELGFMNAVKNVLPGSRVLGCLFHFTQSVWRHAITECKLKSRYSKEKEIRESVQMLLSLPFVPLADIDFVFTLIYEEIHEDCIPLFTYVQVTYVRGIPARGKRKAVKPRYPPESWNVYQQVLDRSQRTNNVVEGWHSKFQKMISTHHANIWKFLEHVKHEQQDNEDLIIQLEGGHTKIRHPIKKRYVLNQGQIESIVGNYYEYKNNDKLIKYLLAISRKLKLYTESTAEDEEEEEEKEEESESESD